MSETRFCYEVRDDGYNCLAWSWDRARAEQAAEEIDDDGRGRAVRVYEEEYSAQRHGEAERYGPPAE